MAKNSIKANISVAETKQRERQNRDKQQQQQKKKKKKKRGGNSYVLGCQLVGHC